MRKRILKNVFFAMLLAAMFLTVSSHMKADTESYTTQDLNEQLVMGTLWYQKSAEARAMCYQAFNMARLVFDIDLEEVTSRRGRPGCARRRIP